MRKILLAGNWKMHGSRAMVQRLAGGPAGGARREIARHGGVSAISLSGRRRSHCWTAARSPGARRTLNPAAQGAHTGEVSASMLLDFGCRYVLVGHSERRTLYGETDEDVAARFVAALEAGLEPILCVGETLQEREEDRTEAVVERQLEAVLDRCGVEGFRQATVAYEPVWAIGTGRTATPDQAQAVHAFIRGKFASRDDIIAGQLRILYGGSVNGSNAADLFAREDIDGGLGRGCFAEGGGLPRDS